MAVPTTPPDLWRDVHSVIPNDAVLVDVSGGDVTLQVGSCLGLTIYNANVAAQTIAFTWWSGVAETLTIPPGVLYDLVGNIRSVQQTGTHTDLEIHARILHRAPQTL